MHGLFHSADVQGGGDTTVPPRVSKLSVVEVSGKNSGLLSTITRDWWCFFDHSSTFDPVIRAHISNLREIDSFSTLHEHTYLKVVNRRNMQLSPTYFPFNSEQIKPSLQSLHGIIDAYHPEREQLNPHRQNCLRANWVSDPD